MLNITERMVKTSRIDTRVWEKGNKAGIPVIFVHGNFSAGMWWNTTMANMPEHFYCIAPDLRGYGETEAKVVDATRGAKDWGDDLSALMEALNINQAHFIGWSLGGAVVMEMGISYTDKVKTLTLLNPVSPYGFGGTKDIDGTMCYADGAGSGAGCVNPDFVQKIKNKDLTTDSNLSPLNVINHFYYKPPFKVEDNLQMSWLNEAFKEQVGEMAYPGDLVVSDNWPNISPGKYGCMNAISPLYFNASNLVHLAKKPPILWIRGDSDQIVSDNSVFCMGTLGKMGAIPGWMGDDIFPSQPMVAQTRALLKKYGVNGGYWKEEVIVNTGHGAHIEKPLDFMKVFSGFLNDNK